MFIAMCRLTNILDLLLPLLAENDLSTISNAAETLERAAWRLDKDFEDAEQAVQAANTPGASECARNCFGVKVMQNPFNSPGLGSRSSSVVWPWICV